MHFTNMNMEKQTFSINPPNHRTTILHTRVFVLFFLRILLSRETCVEIYFRAGFFNYEIEYWSSDFKVEGIFFPYQEHTHTHNLSIN
jgi:hypothetical protein